MLSKLDKLRSRVSGTEQEVTINTEIYFLAKELGCLGDLLGREYELVYEEGKIKKIVQKPISVPAFLSMMSEMEKDYKNQEKQMKKAKGRKR